ncbi:hypothetical protein [Dietzia kunjamensis]|uniref:hypothetical protein n=1 Tax=Dietzia kunjamensis TaxID=322509 RepID=UPI0039BC8024
MPSSSTRRLARLEIGGLCAVLVLLVAVLGLSGRGGDDAETTRPPPAGQSEAMKAATDGTPWVFTADEAYAYGKRACEDIRDPQFDGAGGFYMGVRKTWVELGLDSHGLSAEEQVEHHKRLHADAVRIVCPELRAHLPAPYR